jgi:beta-glucosidase
MAPAFSSPVKIYFNGLMRFGAAIPAIFGVCLASSAEPVGLWQDVAQPAEVRADALLQVLSLDQKIDLVLAKSDGDHRSLAPLGVPALSRVDASCGLRGDEGVTAFPVPLALAATFDTELAAKIGAAIAQEARQKRWNVILGPTVDVARVPLGGRLAESYGEDPLVNAAMGQAVAAAMQAGNAISMVKHFTAYNQEAHRLTHDINVSERTLREVYDFPFDYIVAHGGADSFMTSYPKINGVFVCENPEVLAGLKHNPRFKGYLTTDYEAGSDVIKQLNAGIDSASLQTRAVDRRAFSDGRVSRERLDDAARRMLYAMFKNGLYDHPLPVQASAVVSTKAHRALAVRAAEQSTVLLKNRGGLLPLSPDRSVAIIGPAGRDLVFGVQGSSHVDPGLFTTGIEAINAAVGGRALVTHSRGTLGDVNLPLLSWGNLRTTDGQPGLVAEYFENEDMSGEPVRREIVSHVELRTKPVFIGSDKWSVRFRGQLVPAGDGLARFSADCSGSVKLALDGHTVIEGSRGEAHFFAGPGGPYVYALHGTYALRKGEPVGLTVDYSTRNALWARSIVLGWQPDSLIPAAVESARQADVAVVFVNLVSGEEMDRANLLLPGDQNALVAAVAKANANTIVILNTPGPVLMPWLDEVAAVMQIWYPGSAGGEAAANVLYGQADPGGRLPVTFPADDSQGPAVYDGSGSISYDEGVFVGYRYFQKHDQRPLFPFGFGLAYAKTGFSTLAIGRLGADDDSATVSVNVTNTSDRAGGEVVQVYTGRLAGAAVDTPDMRLAGFARVELAPGESRKVSIRVPRQMVSYWDEGSHAWATPRGVVPVLVGKSSADILLRGEMTVE